MKPNPFSELNHLTVPVAIFFTIPSICVGVREFLELPVFVLRSAIPSKEVNLTTGTDSRPLVTERLKQPTRIHGRAARIPMWPCSGGGLPGRHRYRRRRCALAAPFQSHRRCEHLPFPVPPRPLGMGETRSAPWHKAMCGRSSSCCTFLQLALTGRYPASCPVELRLSSRGLRHRRHPVRLRPPGG